MLVWAWPDVPDEITEHISDWDDIDFVAAYTTDSAFADNSKIERLLMDGGPFGVCKVKVYEFEGVVINVGHHA